MASGDQSQGELRTARALNTVAMIGAGHALYTSLPEASRARAARAIVARSPRKVVAAASRARRKLTVPKGAGKKALYATTAGWLGFHGAEMAGDVMARRSINNQLKKLPEKEDAVKAYETPVDFSKAVVRGTGHGVNLAKSVRFNTEQMKTAHDAYQLGFERPRSRKREAAGMIGGAAAGGALTLQGMKGASSIIRRGVLGAADRAEKHPNGRTAKIVEHMGRHQTAWARGVSGAVKSPMVILPAAGSLAGGRLLRRKKAQPQPFPVVASKRYFDSEADRQRRLGTYAGLGGGSALVLGDAARRQFTVSTERHAPKAGRKRGALKRVEVGLKEGKRLRTPALLGGAAALSAIGGAAAYKHGINERNRPYS